MCEYCEMKPHRSGRLEWMAGDEYGEGYSTAQIEHDSRFGWRLYVSDYDPLCDETDTIGIGIANCPWCGRRLEVDA